MEIIDKTNYTIVKLTLLFGIIGIIGAGILGNIFVIGVIAILPIMTLYLYYSFNHPILFWYFLVVINYLIMGLGRYVAIPKVSIVMDAMLLFCILVVCVNGVVKKTIKWSHLNCSLCIGTFIWCLYCISELLNPTADLYAWIASKNLIYNAFVVSVVTMLVVTKRAYLRSFIYIFAILSLLAVVKTFMQRYIGFDAAEYYWLHVYGGAKTHIISSGIRYFSIFTDASNMGSNMGYSAFFLGVVGLYCSRRFDKFLFFSVSALCLYALVLSGTRGALIVPIGGLAAFAVLTKSVKLMTLSSIGLVVVYVFFALTMIGQNNASIRRMRSAFNPSKDASYVVRLNNQAILSEHMKGKWFGEGLGLSGVENKKHSIRFTTSIPTDSWLVKIWVETGIVGLALYITIMFAIFLHCTYITLFKVDDRQVVGLFIAIIGGSFGLTLSSYGNLFFGQYPTYYMVYFGFGIIMNYKFFVTNEDDNRCLY